MKKLILLLPILLLLFHQRDNDIFIAPDGYGEAYADTTSLMAIPSASGQMKAYNSTTWTTARDNTAAQNVYPNSAVTVGSYSRYPTSEQYGVSVGRIVVNVPNMNAKPDSACIILDGLSNNSVSDTLINAISGQGNLDTLLVADFNKFIGWVSGSAHTAPKLLAAPWNMVNGDGVTGYSTNYNFMPLSSEGLDSLYAHRNSTWVILLIDEKAYSRVPTLNDATDSLEVIFTGTNGTTKPRLWVDYTPYVAPMGNTGARGQVYPFADRRSGRIW